jgi:FkbM family methyltransferase
MNRFEKDLIFDIGMHLGEDTEYYIKKGFRVVGFEADPNLAKHCRERFSSEIKRGLVVVIEGAIAPDDYGQMIDFYSSSVSVWGSISQDWVKRNKGLGASSNKISVRRIDIRNTFEEFGVPFFVKIDIEGMDIHVLEVISNLSIKPKYISIESEKVSFDKLIQEMDLLKKSGYSSFKVVQQKDIPGQFIKTLDLNGDIISHQFLNHSSGAFGEDVSQPWIDYDGAIQRYKAIFRDYQRFGDVKKIGLEQTNLPAIISDPGWFDTHAKLMENNENDDVATVIVTCKNRLDHLKRTLPNLTQQAKIDLIVVDYGCEQGSGSWIRENFPKVKVVLVSDDPIFSLSRARNIGALHAKTETLVFLDADTLINFDISEWIKNNISENEFYTVDSSRDASLAGILIVGRSDFLKLGGYDEVFRGWGWEDTELIARLKKTGLRHLKIQQRNISSIPHDDSLRQFSVADGGSGSKDRAMVAGFLYSKIKSDIQAQYPNKISSDDLNIIMLNVRSHVEKLFDSEANYSPFDLNINLNSSFLKSIKIIYELKKFIGKYS